MDGARPGRRTLTRPRVLALALALVAIAGVVVGTVTIVRGPTTPAYADTAARQEVLGAASKFAASVNTYDVTDLEPYRARVEPLLTKETAKQFQRSTDELLSKFASTKIKAVGTTKQAAVESIDDDSASVLAVVDVKTEPADAQVGQPRLRWRISLVRSGDRWLVDTFANVAVAPSASPSPSATPSTPGGGS